MAPFGVVFVCVGQRHESDPFSRLTPRRPRGISVTHGIRGSFAFVLGERRRTPRLASRLRGPRTLVGLPIPIVRVTQTLRIGRAALAVVFTGHVFGRSSPGLVVIPIDEIDAHTRRYIVGSVTLSAQMTDDPSLSVIIGQARVTVIGFSHDAAHLQLGAGKVVEETEVVRDVGITVEKWG